MKNPADSTESAGELGRLIPYIPSYHQFYNFRFSESSESRFVDQLIQIFDVKILIQLGIGFVFP